jgi:chromate transporter
MSAKKLTNETNQRNQQSHTHAHTGGLVTLADSRREGKLAQYFNVNASYDDDASIYRRIGIPVWAGVCFLLVWLVVLVTVVVVRSLDIVDSELFLLFESFWRIGSIIYGGGQVVLPMLLTEVVSKLMMHILIYQL